MDETDLAILRILATNGRATLQDVADRVGLRRPSVHERVKRLEADGAISGYSARLDPESVGAGLLALVFLKVTHGKGQDCLTACGRVADALKRVPQVLEAHTLAGDDDMVLKVRASGVLDLERVVLRDISGVPGVDRVRTSVVLSTQLDRPLSPAPQPARRSPRQARART